MLKEKLLKTQIDSATASWIGYCVISSRGAPQVSVLIPFLFTLQASVRQQSLGVSAMTNLCVKWNLYSVFLFHLAPPYLWHHPYAVGWWISSQTDRISSTWTIRTGFPQGCMLSPLIYTEFTHDCVASVWTPASINLLISWSAGGRDWPFDWCLTLNTDKNLDDHWPKEKEFAALFHSYRWDWSG